MEVGRIVEKDVADKDTEILEEKSSLNVLESIIGSVSLVSGHSVSQETECVEKVNDDIADCAIVDYIEKNPTVSHKEPVFFHTLRSGRVFYSEDDSIKNPHQDPKFRKKKVAAKKKTDSPMMKITSIETNDESESSHANAMATESARVSEKVIAPDENMEVCQHEIEPEEELEVTDEIPDDNNDEIPDDMPLSVYMPKVRKGKRKTVEESSPGKDDFLDYMLHTTINLIKVGPSKRPRNDEETVESKLST
ncbi:hypothetical protein ZOSMA_83G00190 [Zostera marina]|uniref:Uncharacterized protein n=1 Tax=Zostera marina TaxID=29655 RepID=A0A0K9NNV8_ZOSMR|nr:hypothetical protein ZOSMA_83G00190 [Zostera marina]